MDTVKEVEDLSDALFKIVPLKEPRAYGEYVLIRPIGKVEKSQGGIIIPAVCSPEESRGVVVAVGQGKPMIDHSARIVLFRPEQEIGDVVIFRPMGGYQVMHKSVTHWAVPEAQVVMKIGEVPALKAKVPSSADLRDKFAGAD